MDKNLVRAFLAESLGVFALVYFGAGVVCVNQMTTAAETRAPADVSFLEQPKSLPAALNVHQPGLVGIALAHGLILAVMLAATVAISGGYLNPAITIMLWVFNRLDSIKTAWFLAAQFLGAVLAGMCLRFTFDARDVLQAAHIGTPHLNPLVYPVLDYATLAAGTGVELILTFFLVFAIFGIAWESARPWQMGSGAAAVMIAGVLIGFPLTGAAFNPARWFGPFLWEWAIGGAAPGRGPLADVVVYVTGPILGALLAGVVAFKILAPIAAEKAEAASASEVALKVGQPPKTKK